MNQSEIKQAVAIGNEAGEVTTVAAWKKAGLFENEEQVKGAFMLAYQQGFDGMGKSISCWMGLTPAEFSRWMSDDIIP